MKCDVKPFMALVFLLGVATVNCDAGTYTLKENPQHSVQYEEAPGFYLAADQCKDYSRQNYPLNIVRCRSMFSNHFYLNGEIVDGRMDDLARNPWLMAEGVFIFMFVLILIVVALYVYMLPTFTAYNRKHPQRFYIMLLNLFLGNTLVGWIAALIWARGREENESV